MTIQNCKEETELYFSPFINEALKGNKILLELYPNLMDNADYRVVMDSRSRIFDETKRVRLSQVLDNQYRNLKTSEAVSTNIEKLRLPNTYTVTTGQQIHLFLGPMFVLYKALGTILLAKKIEEDFPDTHVVPVFWMATEDHDIEEIDYLAIRSKQLKFDYNYKGISGHFPTVGIWEQFKAFMDELGLRPKDDELLLVLEKAYLEYPTLAEATRYLLDQLLGSYGLVVIDANQAEFKKDFIPFLEKDIFDGGFLEGLQARTSRLKQLGYSSLIPARDINHFYLEGNNRYRIDREGEAFRLNGTEKVFSRKAMSDEIAQHPERFSPNVVLRPLYQEFVLPNLAYIAGPSELQYWVQLSGVFQTAGIEAPGLLLRPCIIEIPVKSFDWLGKNGLSPLMLMQAGDRLRENITDLLVNNFELDSQLIDYEKLTLNINSELFKNKSLILKEMKKAFEELGKKLKKEATELKQQKVLSPEFTQLFDKAAKLKQAYFNVNEPWERKTFIIESWLFNNLNISDLLGNGENLLNHLSIRISG